MATPWASQARQRSTGGDPLDHYSDHRLLQHSFTPSTGDSEIKNGRPAKKALGSMILVFSRSRQESGETNGPIE